eukprot:TRINITY_DN5254_c0_g1_i9.p1 TRINITY_DN5254_c0_g1~~TRINITY_DN5254_c0_g1_i9.p1  ORF type:complete len:150 (-),score=14.01 TRINITY_DN5254_c0_g1_i9:700-1149(-)
MDSNLQRRIHVITNHLVSQSSTLQPQLTSGPSDVPRLVHTEVGNDSQWLLLGWKTVSEGNQALVMNAFGKSSVVEGPAVPFLFLESIELLKQITAYPGQYLIVEHKNGNRTHIPGPATEFFNPVLHKSIAVAKALTVCDHTSSNQLSHG